MPKTLLYFCGAVLLMIGVVSLNSAAQSPCGQQGTVSREAYPSAILGQNMFYSVYLPPCYDPLTAYPTLYLMHGSNEDDGQWLRLGLPQVLDSGIQDGRIRPMIAILPFGNVIANRNRFDTLSWSNIFMTELLPYVQAKYAINPTQQAIGGISRGGFWAYQIGLRFPNQFKAIGGHSPFFDLYHAPPNDNPLDLILNATGIEKMRFWLDRGADDYAKPMVDEMAQRMVARGLPHTDQRFPEGQHHNTYWSQHVNAYMNWYSEAFQESDQVTTPSSSGSALFVTNTPLPLLFPLVEAPSTPQATQLTKVNNTLFVPVVAFPSLQTTLTPSDIEAMARGELNSRLVVDSETLARLGQIGILLHPNTRITEAIETALWANRDFFALVPFERLTTRLRVLWVDDLPIFDRLEAYPFWGVSDTPNFERSKLTRLTVSGVTALARNTLKAIEAQGITWAGSGIADYVAFSDLFHISNEVSFEPNCPQLNANVLGGATSFCSKQAHFDLFTQLGVDIVELTGNHNNDYGYTAYQETLNWYRAQEMLVVGGGANATEARTPLLITHNGTRIGWVACNFVGPYYALANDDEALLGGIRGGAMPCDWRILSETLSALRPQVDVLIVSVQQQEVEDYLPLDFQRNDFRRLAELGADVVIGTASHKPQIVEFYRDSFIHYGLGNLFFDQPFWGNMRFFMDTLLLYEGRLMSIELFMGIIDENARPRLMTAQERENFLFFMFRQQNGF